MPGTFIVKPIEANLTHNTDIITKMNPYCSLVVGNTRIKGKVCTKRGKRPHWNDSITVLATEESQIVVELIDKDKITHDDQIGSFVLDLNEVQSSGQVSRWYPLTYKNKAAGEILLETVYQPEAGLGVAQSQSYEQEKLAAEIIGQYQEVLITSQPVKGEVVTTTTTVQPADIGKELISIDVSKYSHAGAHVWTEQRQVVEPHTFIKEVEVVETRSVLKEIEVMEPHKVLRDVEYTQAVPVKKQIEVVEPRVVTKEVEVIEPRLVTKTIQVVENVPVKRQVEVVELRNTLQEVETLEPQTFHKQVQVTEYVPVKQQVEITEPVTLKKTVKYVEPVIKTHTITKEMQPAIIIGERITTEVGPASVIDMIQNSSALTVPERKIISEHQRWVGYETIFGGLNENERLWEKIRLSRLSEEQWLKERQRLLALSEQQRLAEQRKFFRQFYQTETTYSQGGSSDFISQTTVQQSTYTTTQSELHTSKHNPIPN